jgi:hypothetical protein
VAACVQVTPLGSDMGNFPIRDMTLRLIHVTQYFTTYFKHARFLIGDNTF